MVKNLFSVICLVLLSYLVGCNSACQKKPQIDPETPMAAASAPETPLFTHFPTLKTASLSKEQLDAFTKFTNEEVCPCDCPQTFAGCLQHDHCKAAVLLGQWVVDRLAEGIPSNALFEAVNKEIGMGYAAQPVTIQTAGYAHKGSQHPAITIVEFADFECAHCQLTSQALDVFVHQNNTAVELFYKHFPLPMHTMAKKAAIATEAAAEQGQFWAMHDVVFKTQSMLSDDLLLSHAKSLKLDVKRFQADLHNPVVIGRVDASAKEAEKLGLNGTPSIFFNGRPYHLSHDAEGFALRLAMEQARSQNQCG